MPLGTWKPVVTRSSPVTQTLAPWAMPCLVQNWAKQHDLQTLFGLYPNLMFWLFNQGPQAMPARVPYKTHRSRSCFSSSLFPLA